MQLLLYTVRRYNKWKKEKNSGNFQLVLLVHNQKNDIMNEKRKHLGESPKFSSFVNNEKKDMVQEYN